MSNFAVYRSLREVVAAAERKAHQEEEIVGQEVYTEPILQRVIYVWSSVRTNSGRRHTFHTYSLLLYHELEYDDVIG